MKITLSVIKADIGSIGGHIQPSALLVEEVRKNVSEKGKKFLIDSYVGYTGDDIAILMTHTGGLLNEQLHKLTRLLFEGKEVAIYGDGSSRRDYTYIDDVVGGGLGAVFAPPRHPVQHPRGFRHDLPSGPRRPAGAGHGDPGEPEVSACAARGRPLDLCGHHARPRGDRL